MVVGHGDISSDERLVEKSKGGEVDDSNDGTLKGFLRFTDTVTFTGGGNMKYDGGKSQDFKRSERRVVMVGSWIDTYYF